MSITKRISRAGMVVIPKELRAELGLALGSAVNIDTDGEYIIIRKHVPICRFCGSAENVTRVMSTEICAECADKIYRKAGRKHAGKEN